MALLLRNRLDMPLDAPLPIDLQLVLPIDEPPRYRVRPGDTLISIGRHFGVSTAALARRNRLENANQLRAGAELAIPAGALTACDRRVTGSTALLQATATQATLGPSRPIESIPTQSDDTRSREALIHARTAIRAAEERYQSADFPRALALVAVARHILEPLTAGEQKETFAARASWVSGQALVGLGRSTEAIEELRGALQLDPSLAATPELSPKIAALVETAQARLP